MTTTKPFPIPRIIHQTYKNDKIPDHWKPSQRDWKRHHPQWTYWLWTDEDNLQFMKQQFPELLDLYLAFPHKIMQVDMVRYCILYKWGGLYSDLDQAPCRAIDQIFEKNDCQAYFASSSYAWVTNSLMASKPGAAIWPFVFSEIRRAFHDPTIAMLNRHFYIMNVTGPIMLTGVVNRHNTGVMGVLPTSFNPHDYDEEEGIASPNDPGGIAPNSIMNNEDQQPGAPVDPTAPRYGSYTRPTQSDRGIQWMRKLQGSGSWHHLDSKILEFIVAQKQFFIVVALLCFIVGILFVMSVIVYGLFHICRKTYKSLNWSPQFDIPITYADHLDLLAFRNK